MNIGEVVPVGTLPAIRSTVPYEYPSPPFDTVIVSTLESLLITIVASAPNPSPRIGTLVYVMFAVPTPTPRSLTVTIFSCPLVEAFSLTDAFLTLLLQSEGTGI